MLKNDATIITPIKIYFSMNNNAATPIIIILFPITLKVS